MEQVDGKARARRAPHADAQAAKRSQMLEPHGEPDINPVPLSGFGAVSACGFSFAYPGAAAIGPLDWRVEEGAFQLLVGATGSGKTTLLRNVVPALAPTGARAGELAVFGYPVDALDAAGAAALVGYVAQNPENQVVCDTVWHEMAFGLENLGVPQAEMRRRVAETAHFFGIEPWFRREVAALSGGQKQMLTLASVMAARPRLLLLDEPTAQLDPVAERNFLHALFRINRELGVTVVVATHAPEAMAAYATEALELAQGRLRAVPLEQLAARPLDVAAARRACAAPGREVAAAQPARRPSGDDCGKGDAPIVLHDVYLRYRREDDWVLRGCDLSVRAGSVSALLGGTGSGKSTLLRAVAGTLKPERGRVRNDLVRRQALLPQNPRMLFACDTVDAELREWQGSCGYGDAAVRDALCRFGLESARGQHPYDLSGGQQQMLALAKLLLTDPDLLLLDEPTKGLDAAWECELARVVVDLRAAGVTVLIATHDLPFAALAADEVSLLFDGALACTEPPEAFFAENLFYRPAENAFARRWMRGCDERA